MTVHVLMPVFNRLPMTQTMIADIAAQQVDEPLSVIVIDDGSSDGTGAWLSDRRDVHVLNGDGTLWWGGAIDLGLRYVFTRAAPNDWVLFVNNDTRIAPDFIQRLLETARNHSKSAVGSVVRDLVAPHNVLSLAPVINAWHFRVTDALEKNADASAVLRADALSGRGVLFPLAALLAVSGMRPRWLPHYLADYELSLRVRSAGWRLLIDQAAPVFSHDEYGNSFRGATLRERFFSVRSPSYLPALVRFWWEASNFWQRVSLSPRLVLFALFPNLRKKA